MRPMPLKVIQVIDWNDGDDVCCHNNYLLELITLSLE